MTGTIIEAEVERYSGEGRILKRIKRWVLRSGPNEEDIIATALKLDNEVQDSLSPSVKTEEERNLKKQVNHRWIPDNA